MPTPSKHSRHPALAALGNSIRAERKKHGLSQEKLAQMADLDRSYLGQVERGENSIAMLPLLRIAEVLETTVARLIDNAGF